MSKKLLKILKMISKDLKDREFISDEILETLDYDETDIMDIGEELENLEFYDYLEDDELDILRGLIAYILMKDSSREKEEIFSLIFAGGRRIVWN
ncbi:MAG: hypothetical protein WAV13_05335 [Thermodesulfovibrionales bacterium]